MAHSSIALTPMQMGMLYESVGTSRPWINIEQVVVAFDGSGVSPAQITDAWTAVQARHDALQIQISWNGGVNAQQRRSPDLAPQITFDHWDQADRDARLVDLLKADRDQGVDLDTGLPWRVHVINCGQDPALMLLTAHHAILDGRSLAKVVSDVFRLLETSALDPQSTAGRTFDDFCMMSQDDTFASDDAATHYGKYLQDFEGAGDLELPVLGPLAEQGARMHLTARHLTPDITAALRHTAKNAGATMANAVQAAWGLVLGRWEGRADISFGAVRTGRHAMDGLSETAGCFINTLPMRMRLTPDLTLKDALRKLRADTVAAHGFEQSSLNDLRQWGGVPGQQALFSSIVMFEKADLEHLVRSDFASDRIHQVTLHEEGGQPLTLAAYDGDALKLVLEHDPALVSAEVAAGLARHLETLLVSMADADPHAPVGALQMLDQTAVADLATLAASDQPLGDTGDCLVRRFADVLLRTPEAAALIVAETGQSLTFRELDHRANGIAMALVKQNIGPGDIVAIGLGRSAEFVLAVLGVLKTGAAFLPCDPSYPDPVKAHMISDSGARALISFDDDFVPDAPPRVDPVQVSLSEGPPLPQVDPGARAYVIYTSGSTGVPKGVQVTRANLLAHIAAVTDSYGLSPRDRVLQFASLSFDVALEEVFPTLMAGGTLILRTEEMAQSTSVFLEEAARLHITVANLPAMFWEVLTADMMRRDVAPPADLRLMITGSERVNPQSLADWHKVAPNVRWMNGYGPTEATITCTLFESDGHPVTGEVPIGRPTGHARCHVLAPDHSLAPIGAIGELVVGGPAVTMGYIGRPEVNAQSFVTDVPHVEDRIYLTGDRAQWRADRNLNFFGRNDRQVKVRGFRIDLRQVERAIEEEWPDVRVVAGVLDKGSPSARLAAWVTSDSGDIDLDGMRDRLRRLLASHMQPVLVAVDAFPKTAGGKIDMKALPEPEAPAELDPSDLDTGDALETDICAIMAGVLGRKGVGRDDNFFDLGGHSLLSVELIGRVEAQTGKRIGIGDFQTHASPRQMAVLIREGRSGPRHIIPIQPQGDQPPLLAIHILGANEEYFHPLARHLGPDQPVMGVSVGSLGKDTPTGIEFTAKRYCEDINRTYPTGPLSIMAVSLGSFMAFELVRQLRISGRDIGALILFDAAGPQGRPRKTGVAKWIAHLRRAYDLGPGFPLRLVRNRIFEMQNRAAAERMARIAEAEDGTVAPTTVFEFIASNERAVAEYEPKPLDFPITILRAKSNVYDTEEGVANALGWKPVAAGGFDIIDVPGGHLSMLQEPHVGAVAAVIKDLLDQRLG